MAIGVTENTFQLNIVSAEGTLFSGPAHALAVSGADGELGIRPGHSPLLSKIKPGVTVFVTDLKADEQVLYVSGGLVEVQPDSVTVLADTALHAQISTKLVPKKRSVLRLKTSIKEQGTLTLLKHN